MSLPKLLNFIHGELLENKSGQSFDVINPATNEVIYQTEIADEFIKEQAIESAKQGFATWSAISAVERSRILLKAVALLRERNVDLAKIEVLDTGKPIQEADCVDIETGADVIEYFAGLAPTQLGSQQTVGNDFFYTRKEPLGICAGIGAWNYPLQIACWKSGPALAAGNVLIFKPSEETPSGAVELAKIFIEAGMPAGVFNVVHGAGDVGQWLTTHSDIEKVSFTGEVGTGQKVMQSAASNLKEVTMELGGKSPLIVFDDAEITEAVSAAMLGNFYTQGEVCTNCTRVYVQRNVYDEFIEELKNRTENNIVMGDPLDPNVNLGALISKKHLALVLNYIELGKQQGATVLTGGYQAMPKSAPNGNFVAPTIFVDCTDDMTIVKEEIFGPVMCVLPFDDEDDVIKRANNTDLGLAAGVFSQNIKRAHRVIHQLNAGICWINSYGNSPAEMPVGGYKRSGIGRENGVETLNSYTQTKSIYVGMSQIESPF
ncbi:NAD/NADP-dependent betaine aldehyde dehydrogenase [Pseudoalteromonas sp. P1-9]|uniref:betaine-aldehyde dehydrogenase n=1 Tax=Pseudoalteromonas sp. P1-9 TaxID=1710354 RepID=UPI0006D61DCF|nr:betaine-aldehyde dehydrogenase [Pseudoalteromonas sp. P1-9]KPV94538.1 NAD/NADP-dependent betaine aldehyde dehydrogenase [Pseudoalteromonas sp. P1-9]